MPLDSKGQGYDVNLNQLEYYLKMSAEYEKQSSGVQRLERGVIALTIELLRDFKISRIIYILIKVVEHLQIMHFLMRGVSDTRWTFSFVSTISSFLSFISLDYIFKASPEIFPITLYLTFTIFLIMLVLMVLTGHKTGWGVRKPSYIKSLTPLISGFLYMFKTVFIIPQLNIVCIAIAPSIANQLNITGLGIFTETLGVTLGLLVVIISVYVVVFFRDGSPFSQLPHPGQTVAKGFIWMGLKALLVVYALLDVKGQYQFQGTVAITIGLLLLIAYSHYEVGIYKAFYKDVQLHLLYMIFTVGILHSSNISGGDISTVTYLVPLNILTFLSCKRMLMWKKKRVATNRFIMIEESREMEEHIVYLIQLIDCIHLRENKFILEGYIQNHRRECRIGEDCPCRRLCLLKEESGVTIKLWSFKLVVMLLIQSKRKFPNQSKIDLLLGLIYHFRIKNSLQAVYSITKMASHTGTTTIDKLYKFYYLQIIEKEIVEMDEIEVTKSSEIKKYFDYTNKLVHFENSIENCTKHHIEFWRLVMDSNPDIRHLEELGTQITRSKDQLKKEFDYLVDSSPNSIHLLTIYGKFLLEVTNEETYNVKYIQKADNIIKNIKESTKIDETSTKYEENAKTAVVVISGGEENIGTVLQTNNLVRDLIGFKRSELIEKNVSAIMPKIYGEVHDEVLQRYTKSSESKVNGHQRVVPALTKDGLMLPVTALTKVLPSLISGIQIVAFIAKFSETTEEEETRQTHYLLYRTDTEQVMGVSEGCQTSLGISPMLIYGHPLNVNNELMIHHLFGVSFEKSNDGRTVASLEVGEIYMNLNTKHLGEDFVINKTVDKDGLLNEDEDGISEGVDIEVGIKQILASVYNEIPLRLISIFIREKKTATIRKSRESIRSSRISLGKGGASIPSVVLKDDQLGIYGKKTKKDKLRDTIVVEEPSREGDDFKNLKDFKNFISVKREPSAITAMSTICLLFLIIITASIVGLITNYLEVITINNNILSLYKLTLESEIATPEVLSLTDFSLFAHQLAQSNTSGFNSATSINQSLSSIIALGKGWQLDILPLKFFFNSSYQTKISEYSLYSTGSIIKQDMVQEEVINDYITTIETFISSNIVSYASSNGSSVLQSNMYQEYSSAEINMLYSIRDALNASNAMTKEWYTQKLGQRQTVIVVVHSLMMGITVLWVILLLPYILSVTKINNRVLSLFTLISSQEVSRLICSCLTFLNSNLKEATVNQQDLNFYQKSQDMMPFQDSNQESGLNSMGSPSSQHRSLMEHTHGELKRGGNGRTFETDNMFEVQEKFEKMINSEDRNKKIVIVKFISVSLLLLGFIVFYLFFNLTFIASIEKGVNNYLLVGRRPALIRNLKLLLTKYLADPTHQFAGFSSLKTLNQDIISQFYALEGNLLYLSLGKNTDLYNQFNNGDCCAAVSSYQSFVLFNDVMSSAECYSLNSGVFQKGLKTGVVSVLEDLRWILSNYPTSVPESIRIAKLLEYNAVVKYIETPMMAVLNAIEGDVDSQINLSRLIIVVSGSLFLAVIFICWKIVWQNYLSEMNIKIWRIKGLLNLIPMRIITANNQLKNQFTSGELEKAVR